MADTTSENMIILDGILHFCAEGNTDGIHHTHYPSEGQVSILSLASIQRAY